MVGAVIANSVLLKPPPALLKTLKNSSEELAALTKAFKKLLELKSFKIYTFYETKQIALGRLVSHTKRTSIEIETENC